LGCVPRIKNIEVGHAEPVCVRDCAGVHSRCVAESLPTRHLLIACADGYSVCTRSCPDEEVQK
jgi:hypothetical protein